MRQVYTSYRWHQQAACRDEPDPRTFFPDEDYRDKPSAGKLLLPLLICWDCPVRREFLEDAFQSWDYTHAPGIHTEVVSTLSTQGVWGATTEVERDAVKDLPTGDAIGFLDRTTDERMERRVRTYLENQEAKRKTGGRPLGIHRILKRIDAILEERGRTRCDSGA